MNLVLNVILSCPMTLVFLSIWLLCSFELSFVLQNMIHSLHCFISWSPFEFHYFCTRTIMVIYISH